MTDTEQPDRPANAADAELADAMDSIQSTGEDWRSSERATETAENETASGDGASSRNDRETEEEIDNG